MFVLQMHSGGTHRQGAWRRRGRAGGALAAAAVLAVLAGWGPGVAGAGAAACAHADSGIDDATADQLANAVRCLINDDRKARDRHRLDNDGKLRRAASRHSKAMFAQNCWTHQCPGEPRLERRIRDTGYLNGAKRWSFAENFGCADTPEAMLSTWLQNNFARGNIRDRAFRDVGAVAVRDQVPASGCDADTAVTFTVVFARRSP